jgi:LysR family transcriptional regulator, cell division regulator
MDISTLVTFLSVAEHGSVSLAAQDLNTVQSNVTGRIRRLEDELDASLFIRHSRGVKLTASGEIMLAYAKRVLQLVDDARRAVKNSAGEAGTIRIGSMETTAAVRLTDTVADFHRRFPVATLTLTTAPADQLVRQTLEWGIDGAFVAGPVDHPDLVSVPICKEELVLVSARAQKRAPEEERTLLVFPMGCAYRARAEAFLRRTGGVPIRLMELGTLDGILGCVAAGVGLTLMPRSIVDRRHYQGLFNSETIKAKDMQITTVFIRRKDQPPPKLLAAFLDIVRQKNAEA